MKSNTEILLKIFSFALFLITLGCSAFNDSYLNLEEDEKFAFKKSDTLVYVSNLNNKDSFRIENIYTGYVVYDKQNYIQYQSITIKPLGKTSISKALYTNRYYSCAMTWGDFTTGFRREEKHPITCTFNNKVFEKVYKLSKDPVNSRNEEPIFYSYKFGVIQYQIPNGEIYILTLK
jgi:hypothetical protein